ncbi:MAG: leucine--tRNA ligase [Anaerolineae bacterium]|nr:leucine--tRNA ligase [Anaerolineae bacterium]
MATKHSSRLHDPWETEARWRQRWAEEATYRTPDPTEGERPYYCLDFFPYPSGAGLSVGHGRNYVPSDVIARYHRMRGDVVLHPMGWDAFGLPAENEAMLRGVHPAESTTRYAANYRRQLDLLGCSYDWDREINSSDASYYRWNQAFFLMLYRRGLAYRAAAPVNWCETCQTVLASEEVEDGRCWRCHQPMVRRTRLQWYLRVTAYAEELDAALEGLDWPEHILTMQRNWIGRHAGVEIDLAVAGDGAHAISVFTTRVDTLFGVTFVALAPEHPLASVIGGADCRGAVTAYIDQAAQRSDVERHAREPDGVDTGAVAILPDGSHVPIYVADYVLAEVGTGAVMGVPAHDTRDYALAQRLGLPVRCVIAPAYDGDVPPLPFTEPGVLVGSGPFDGMTSAAAQEAITAWLSDRGLGRPAVQYRLRDWLVSRQRYWGTPIPIVHCPVCGEVPVPEDQLPVTLPPMPDYRPRGDGRSPLANVPDFASTTCPSCGGPAERETDTMTGFVCSSWYYMRFTDPHNAEAPFSLEQVRRWLPVDVYVGGAEHAVSHLLYSRFWTKALADAGWVDFREPFPRLRSQGVLHARDATTGAIERMSKSKGNVVTPESVIERYGADATRLHLLFMGPFEANTVWEVEADGHTPLHIEGVRRFLQRVWRLSVSGEPARGGRAVDASEHKIDHELGRAMHRTVRDVTEQMESMHFNTAVSALMAFAGTLDAYLRDHGPTAAFGAARSVLLRLLAPFAPFITEELWERVHGGQPDGSIHHAPWPAWDPRWAEAETVTLVVQVNGRTRARVEVPRGTDEAKVRELVLVERGVQSALGDAAVERIVVVPDRLVAIVTG